MVITNGYNKVFWVVLEIGWRNYELIIIYHFYQSVVLCIYLFKTNIYVFNIMSVCLQRKFISLDKESYKMNIQDDNSVLTFPRSLMIWYCVRIISKENS
jgi:hypothetical protein